MKRRVVELYVIEESYVFVFDKNHLVQKSIQNSDNIGHDDEDDIVDDNFNNGDDNYNNGDDDDDDSR